MRIVPRAVTMSVAHSLRQAPCRPFGSAVRAGPFFSAACTKAEAEANHEERHARLAAPQKRGRSRLAHPPATLSDDFGPAGRDFASDDVVWNATLDGFAGMPPLAGGVGRRVLRCRRHLRPRSGGCARARLAAHSIGIEPVLPRPLRCSAGWVLNLRTMLARLSAEMGHKPRSMRRPVSMQAPGPHNSGRRRCRGRGPRCLALPVAHLLTAGPRSRPPAAIVRLAERGCLAPAPRRPRSVRWSRRST